jgi:hypothetical protein
MSELQKCAECDPVGLDAGCYDWARCLGGDVYGECGDENCYGICSYDGYCTCPCHKRADA